MLPSPSDRRSFELFHRRKLLFRMPAPTRPARDAHDRVARGDEIPVRQLAAEHRPRRRGARHSQSVDDTDAREVWCDLHTADARASRRPVRGKDSDAQFLTDGAEQAPHRGGRATGEECVLRCHLKIGIRVAQDAGALGAIPREWFVVVRLRL